MTTARPILVVVDDEAVLQALIEDVAAAGAYRSATPRPYVRPNAICLRQTPGSI